jgi:hypothetical protein
MDALVFDYPDYPKLAEGVEGGVKRKRVGEVVQGVKSKGRK